MSEDNTPDPQLTYEPVEVALVHEHRILVRGPYNTCFVPRAKRLNGQWDRTNEFWVFPGEREAEVRELCATWFGTDGSAPPDLVDVRLVFHRSYAQDAPEATIFGRVIANTRGRGATIRVGEGVAFIEGDAFSEAVGTGRRIVIAAGSRVQLAAVPRALAESVSLPGVTVSIIDRLPPWGDRCSQQNEPGLPSTQEPSTSEPVTDGRSREASTGGHA